MEQEQHVVSMKKQIRKLKNQLSDLEDRLHAVESTLLQQSSSAYQVANKQTLPIQISVSTTKSGVGQNHQTDVGKKGSQCCLAVERAKVWTTVLLNKSTLRSRSFKAMRHLINLVDVTNIPKAEVDLSNIKPTSSDSVTTTPSSSKALTKRTPTTASQLMKSPLIPTPKSINVNSTVSQGVKQQAVYSNTPVKRFTSIPKCARLYEIVRPDFKGLCFPNDTELHNGYRFKATNRKVELYKLQTQAARLTGKGSAGVWVWNSKIQVGQYLSLRKISSTSSAKLFINRFSGWATDGKAGHSPPSTEMMPAKLLEKLKEFKGYRWYWFRDRWLLFTLHEE
ncbi:hypothetical protein BY996DRAFT_8533067 [Phakopsora pachyrhizi]|nr:hypothetical protein BY996DRAFT_8533067 [Phakopsora pachyrhizi]